MMKTTRICSSLQKQNLQHRDEFLEEDRRDSATHACDLTAECNGYYIRRHVHPVDQRLAENQREKKHRHETRVFDVDVACKETPIAGGFLPYRERSVAETELQAVARVFL